MNRLGETGRRMGSLVLSWGAVKHGAADLSDGKNVVLHELLTSSTSKMTQPTGCRGWRRANSN